MSAAMSCWMNWTELLQMYVVVPRALRQQQAPLQIVRARDERTVTIAIGVVDRLSHVALGINRVIVAPVGYRRDGDAGAKAVAMRHRIESERAAPTPSPPAQPLGVELRIFCQHLVERGHLVAELYRAEVVICGLGKVPSPPAHAAVVYVQHRIAVLRQHLIEEECPGAPLVGDRPGAGAAVWIQNQRHACRRGLVPGQYDSPVKSGRSIRGLQ